MLLQEAARACKPGGHIYLLEHGRASYDWLNKILDESAAGHHYRWGCWWNRDIVALVSKVGQSVCVLARDCLSSLTHCCVTVANKVASLVHHSYSRTALEDLGSLAPRSQAWQRLQEP